MNQKRATQTQNLFEANEPAASSTSEAHNDRPTATTTTPTTRMRP
jgi:hypothetical protein